MEDNKNTRPGYPSPLWAMKNGPREKILYVVTVQPNANDENGDYLSTVDVDPQSETFCQVIHRAYAGRRGQEFHHTGWNTCSSCHSCSKACDTPKRDKLVLPCLMSDAIFIFDVGNDPKAPKLFKIIEGDVLRKNNVSAPHTSHCLANGNIMISTMGDAEGNSCGDFILFDKNFDCLGTWTKGKKAICGYDFWYQPHFNIMVASEWGAPKIFRRGYENTDIESETDYGRRINFYDWKEQKLIDTIHLGDEGITPLEIRFTHNPKRCEGFVGACLYSNVFRFYKKNPTDEKFTCEKIIDVPAKKIEGSDVNGMMTDILLSLDDRFLYFSNWMHGDVRQYDVSDPSKPILTGQLFLGGVVLNDSNVKVIEDKELKQQPAPCVIKGRRLEGGPQMLQLSLDGKRLYVSSSLFSPWDKQFYPKMVRAGGTIVQIDIDVEKGGMKLNENFLVDFGNEPNGPSLPHEMRYPGGDCTSDIWLANDD
ncbi:CLUMA_CG008266, isoform A [Clunio marinus]|uniref:CLUMA_CG008266, isoform A n=1 Tax=Clunio marinus TaxID=568069 RepID=A0A1J1I5A8_9DIPT|nr:CLUMA_CG008266, isoform A [Clunio marinus]